MVDRPQPSDSSAEPRFIWHPTYRGQSVAEVRDALATEIASDQRAYALTLEGAEEHEGDSLQSVISLERKWGPYDLNWAEVDPGPLADRIVNFELERERLQEMIPYSDYRNTYTASDDYRDPVSAQRLESPTARGIVVLIVLLILVGAWFLFFR
jgi:hypothetical protein